jgi:hypothetical protein
VPPHCHVSWGRGTIKHHSSSPRRRFTTTTNHSILLQVLCNLCHTNTPHVAATTPRVIPPSPLAPSDSGPSPRWRAWVGPAASNQADPAVAILDVKGKVSQPVRSVDRLCSLAQSLIQRSYRDDVPPSYIERFLPLVLDMEEENVQVTPCFTDEGINYMHIRHNNLYREFVRCLSLTPVLALSKRNSNAAEIIFFLHRLCAVLSEYFKELEEESIRDNFVIIYELLDEMMDFGYPQTTESKILQE